MMRIESGFNSRISPLLPPTRVQQTVSTTPRQRNAQISAAGRLFATGQQALVSLPPVRDDQVRQFQSLLLSGRYRINGEACAGAMLSDEEVADYV